MIDEWAKEIAPSPNLRKWYNHEAERWPEFKRLYDKELNENTAIGKFVHDHQHFETMTLLFAARDPAHAHAQVLQKHLLALFSK
jgi:uncharacterized protein YeaO (DUF488 family)